MGHDKDVVSILRDDCDILHWIEEKVHNTIYIYIYIYIYILV